MRRTTAQRPALAGALVAGLFAALFAESMSARAAEAMARTPLPWRDARAGVAWWRLGSRAGASDAQLLLNATMNWQPTGSPWSFAANAYHLTDRRTDEGVGADALQDALMREAGAGGSNSRAPTEARSHGDNRRRC
jgi:hypothetical protein